MSQNPQVFDLPVDAVRVVDAKMRFNQQRKQVINIGPKQNSWYSIPASTGTATSNVNFVHNVTDTGDMIDRRLMLHYYLTVTIDAPVGDMRGLYGTNQSLRFMPINASCTAMNLQINNSTVAAEPYQWLDAMCRFIPMEVLRKDLSASPATPDLLTVYNSGAGPKNVTGDYVDNSLASPDLRGSQVYLVSSAFDGGTVTTFNFEIYEPAMISPLSYQEEDANAFVGVQGINLQLNHNWSSGVIWSDAANPALLFTSFNVTFSQAPELIINTMTPNELVEAYNPMKTYAYNSSAVTYNSTPGAALNAGASVSQVSNNIQLNSIPSVIYVFVRRSKEERTRVHTDTFCRINSVSVRFGNKAGLLSNADSRDLYQISKRNGYQYSYGAWYNEQGAVLCLKPDRDLSLDLGEAPGLVVQKQFQITVNYTNQSASNFTRADLVVVPIYAGAFMIRNGLATQSNGLLNPQQILSAPIFKESSYRDYAERDIYGEGFWSDFAKGFKKGFKGTLDLGEKIAPFIPGVGPQVSAALGALKPIRGAVGLGMKKKRSKRGGLMVGGCADCDDVESTSREKLRGMFQKL